MEKLFRSTKHYDCKFKSVREIITASNDNLRRCGRRLKKSLIRKTLARKRLKNNDSRLTFPRFFFMTWYECPQPLDLPLQSPSSTEMLKCRVSYRLALTHSVCCSRTLQQSRCLLSWGWSPDLPDEGHSL